MSALYNLPMAKQLTQSQRMSRPIKEGPADEMLVIHMGETCSLEFERQEEVFSGVLRSSDDDTAWQCGAVFQAHWLESIKLNGDGTKSICVRIPDDEYEDLLSMDCDEMLAYEDEENEGRSPDCENWR